MSRILPSLNGGTVRSASSLNDFKAWAAAGRAVKKENLRLMKRLDEQAVPTKGRTEPAKTRALSPFKKDVPREPRHGEPTPVRRVAMPLGLSKAQMTELTARMIADADLNPNNVTPRRIADAKVERATKLVGKFADDGRVVVTRVKDNAATKVAVAHGAYRADKPRGGAAPRGLWSAVK